MIGGDDGHENLSSVEIYNPQRGLWSLLPEFLNTAKSYMSILVIEDYSSYSWSQSRISYSYLVFCELIYKYIKSFFITITDSLFV